MTYAKKLLYLEKVAFVQGILFLALVESGRLAYKANFETHESLVAPGIMLLVSLVCYLLCHVELGRKRAMLVAEAESK